MFQLMGLLVGLHLARYVLMAGGAWLALWAWKNPLTASRRIQPRDFEPAELRREIAWSLVTAVLFGLFFGASYAGMAPRPLTWPGALGALEFSAWLLLILVLHDAYFYWSHRLLHHPRVFRIAHRTHHLSKNPSPFSALAFHPTEALMQAVWAVPVAWLLPVPSSVWFAFAFVAMFINVLGHCGVELYPRWWAGHPVFGWLNSGTAHNQHHVRLDRNFGLYFTWWDRLCGTSLQPVDVAAPGGVVEPLHRPEKGGEHAAHDLQQQEARHQHRHRDDEEAQRAQ